jgi:hypothetical protein
VTVVPKGRKEVADQEIKSEIKQEDKSSPSQPQAVQSDGANRVPDKSNTSTNVTQDTDRAGKVGSSNSSAPAQEPGTVGTSEKPSVTQTTMENPAVQHIPVETPTVEYISTEKPTVQQNQTEEISASHTSTEKLSTEHIPTEKPAVQHSTTESPALQHIPAEQPTVQHSPTEKPAVQHNQIEELSASHTSTEKSITQERPLSVIHPKTTSQASHVSELRKDKLEPTIPAQAAEMLSHSEQSESADVKPLVSKVSSEVREDGMNHDSYVKQQKEVEGSQKAQTTSQEPDTTIQSAGNIPTEVPVVPDRSTSRVSETKKNASEHEKVMYYPLLLLTEA